MTARPFPIRFVLAFALAAAVIVGVAGAVIFNEGRSAAYRAQVRDVDHLASLIRQWVPRDSALNDADRQRLFDTSAALAMRVTLIDGAGRVFFDTHEPVERMANHNDRPEVVAARSGGLGSDRRQSATIGQSSLYVARLLDPNDPTGIVVRASDPRYAAPSMTRAAWAALAASAAAALLTGFALWRLMRREWVNPLQSLANTADLMAAGQWHLRAATEGSEHVRVFSSSLNELAAQTQQRMVELKHRGEELRALVDALPDPILVVDSKSRIMLMNPPAGTALDVTAAQAAGQKLVSVVSDAALLELFEGVLASAPSADGTALLHRTIDLDRGGQRLIYHAVASRTAAGVVLIVLRDVTALSAAVQMKTDFVANASHELRTPIAAFKAAFETLRDVYIDDPAQAARCIEIVDGHMHRLEEMLRDLLDLSRVESPDLKPFIKDIKTADLLAMVRSALGSMATQKGVELRFDGASGPLSIRSDERLINLVLKNLVENSIKFTPAGGSITVRIDPDGTERRGVRISVADTGIGIPPALQERIFERFFQVDPSRAGSAGRGTGLGLAIVKHAVAALDGRVEVESEVGEGTLITCMFPPATLSKPANDQEEMSQR